MYQIHTNPMLLEPSIFKVDFGWIPADPMNPDYLEYVQWLFDGNTASEWNPDAMTEETTEPETTQPDMEEEI